MELARAMEYFAMRQVLRTEERATSQGLTDLYLRGWNKALGLFVDNSSKKRGVPLMPTTKEAESWADSVLQHCGRISLCEYVLGLWDTGLIKPTGVGGDTIRFRIANRRSGVEQVEREEWFWLQEHIASRQKPEMDRLFMRFDAVARSMDELVRPWRTHYIAYNASPEINTFFGEWGRLLARTLPGHDSFPGSAPFGGLEFDHYRAAAQVMVSIALKHRHFCLALLNKRTEIRPRNVHATLRSTENLALVLEPLLEGDRSAAEQALEPLVLNVENRDYHCASTAAGYHPPLIAMGSNDVLLSVFGCLGSSFSFMLGEIRRRYPGDWDRATNLREEVFRKELYDLFWLPQMLKFDRNIVIREGRRTITDIDALILDRETGTLGLFQLKWQDPFGDSMRKRESRRKNFLNDANEWVEAVDQWITAMGIDRIGKVLGITNPAASGIRRVRLFVIGRNFSGFSGESLPDERAAWGLWPQVLRLMSVSSGSEDLIDDLFEALIEDAPVLKLPTVAGAEWLRLKLGDKIVVVEPPS
jgi:hypothetical protein